MAFTSIPIVLRSNSDAARRKLMLRDEEVSSFRRTYRTFHASVVGLISPCSTLWSEVTARALIIAVLPVCPLVTTSKLIYLRYNVDGVNVITPLSFSMPLRIKPVIMKMTLRSYCIGPKRVARYTARNQPFLDHVQMRPDPTSYMDCCSPALIS